MKTNSTALRDSMVSGSAAAILSTGALALMSQRDWGSPWRATNDNSHAVWGEPAFYQRKLDWAHTGLGFGIHHASSILWSAVFEKAFGDQAEQGRIARALAGGLAVAGLACFVDYKLTPRRFQPGFERHLSRPSMALFYTVFGLGMAVAGLLRARQR